MSHRTTVVVATLMACTAAVAPLAAQQDTAMMQHDTAMMSHDTAMMSHDSMSKDQMGKDQMGKDAMGHDSAMGMGTEANMMFMGAAGQKAAGDYAITGTGGKQQLKLTDDFAVAPAPDLYLVLANGDTPDKGALYLGKLKQPTGGQTFDLPKGKDLSQFTKLLVWSKKEKRVAASAEWHPAGGGSMEHM